MMAVYTTPATTVAENLKQFRLVATNVAGVATSAAAILTLDGQGNLFVVDGANHTIRQIDIATEHVTTQLGTPGIGGTADGTGTAPGSADPTRLVIDAAGTI